MVFAPGVEGELGIAPRHAPLLTTLKRGRSARAASTARTSSPSTSAAARSRCSRTRSRCSPTRPPGPATSTKRRPQAAKQRAEEAVRGQVDKMDIAEAQAELARAVAQLKAIGQLRKKR